MVSGKLRVCPQCQGRDGNWPPIGHQAAPDCTFGEGGEGAPVVGVQYSGCSGSLAVFDEQQRPVGVLR